MGGQTGGDWGGEKGRKALGAAGPAEHRGEAALRGALEVGGFAVLERGAQWAAGRVPEAPGHSLRYCICPGSAPAPPRLEASGDPVIALRAPVPIPVLFPWEAPRAPVAPAPVPATALFSASPGAAPRGNPRGAVPVGQDGQGRGSIPHPPPGCSALSHPASSALAWFEAGRSRVPKAREGFGTARGHWGRPRDRITLSGHHGCPASPWAPAYPLTPWAPQRVSLP